MLLQTLLTAILASSSPTDTTGSGPVPAQTFSPSDTTGYKRIWSDEFNTDGAPDTTKWNYEQGFVRNKEPQWYQPQNAVCQNGLLVIEARKEKVKNTHYEPSSKAWQRNREYAEYTSSSMTTKGKFDFKFGKVVMRAKIDVRTGMWPAFWMLGSSRAADGWPACGEVDIMEYYRGNLLANWAWQGPKGKVDWATRKFPLKELGGEQWAGDFHEWILEWNNYDMFIYLDGKLLNEIIVLKTMNADQRNRPFLERFYLLVNLALGQDGEKIPDAHMPSQLLVDYIRVYQKR